MAHTAMRRRVRIAERSAARHARRCPFCHDSLGELQDRQRSCRDCGTHYHSDCAGELRWCSTLGCTGVLVRTTRARSEQPLEILREGVSVLYGCLPNWGVVLGVALLSTLAGVILGAATHDPILGLTLDTSLSLGACTGLACGVPAGLLVLAITNRHER